MAKVAVADGSAVRDLGDILSASGASMTLTDKRSWWSTRRQLDQLIKVRPTSAASQQQRPVHSTLSFGCTQTCMHLAQASACTSIVPRPPHSFCRLQRERLGGREAKPVHCCLAFAGWVASGSFLVLGSLGYVHFTSSILNFSNYLSSLLYLYTVSQPLPWIYNANNEWIMDVAK